MDIQELPADDDGSGPYKKRLYIHICANAYFERRSPHDLVRVGHLTVPSPAVTAVVAPTTRQHAESRGIVG